MRAVEDGKLDLAEAGLEEHLYHCLDCRACNTVCPVSIPIGELIVEGRAAVEAKHPPLVDHSLGLAACADFAAAAFRSSRRRCDWPRS